MAWSASHRTSCGACTGSAATDWKVLHMSKHCAAGQHSCGPAGRLAEASQSSGQPEAGSDSESSLLLYRRATQKSTLRNGCVSAPCFRRKGQYKDFDVGSSSLCCECAMIFASGGAATEATGNSLAQRNSSRLWSATQRGQTPTSASVVSSGSCASWGGHLRGSGRL